MPNHCDPLNSGMRTPDVAARECTLDQKDVQAILAKLVERRAQGRVSIVGAVSADTFRWVCETFADVVGLGGASLYGVAKRFDKFIRDRRVLSEPERVQLMNILGGIMLTVVPAFGPNTWRRGTRTLLEKAPKNRGGG